MSYGRPNNRGVPAGRVAWVRDGKAAVDSSLPLAVGDVLEFWTNKGHFAHTVGAVETDERGLYLMSPAKPVGKGDRVFRVRSAAAAFADDPLLPKVPVRGSASVVAGEPLSVRFRLAEEAAAAPEPEPLHPFPPMRDDGAVGEFQGDVVEPARTRAVTAEDVAALISTAWARPSSPWRTWRCWWRGSRASASRPSTKPARARWGSYARTCSPPLAGARSCAAPTGRSFRRCAARV